MPLFWRLLFGHFLADFTFQSNAINKWKRGSIAGMIAHCLMHPVFYALLTFPYLTETWIRWDWAGVSINGITAIALITITHFLEDYWRIYTVRRFKTPDNMLYLIWDQVIHISIIFIFFGVNPSSVRMIPEAWPVLGALAVGATHCSVVLVFFMERDFFNGHYPDDGEKYLAICERGIAFAALTFIHNPLLAWLAALIALSAPRMELKAILKTKGIPSFPWALGGLIALGCGYLGRLIWMGT